MSKCYKSNEKVITVRLDPALMDILRLILEAIRQQQPVPLVIPNGTGTWPPNDWRNPIVTCAGNTTITATDGDMLTVDMSNQPMPDVITVLHNQGVL
jgi:hypothetical protein